MSTATKPVFPSEVRLIFGASIWALKTIWATHAQLTLGLGGMVMLRGILPAGLAWASRGLINVAVYASHGGGAFQLLLPWLLLGFVFALIEALSPLVNKFLLQSLSDDMQLTMNSKVLHHATTLDVASLEDPRLRDTIDRAQQDTAETFSKFMAELQAVCTDVIQVTLMVAILLYLEPLVLVAVGPCALPYLFFRWRTAKLRYSEETSWTMKRRWIRYFISHLTSQQSAIETKLLGLGPLFLAKFDTLMRQFRDRDRRRYRHDFVGGSTFAVLTTVCFYLLFARVAWLVVRGVLTVGDIAIFGGVSARLRVTLERLIVGISNVTEHGMFIANLMTFLQLPPRMTRNGGVTPTTRRGEVELTDVSFSYPGAQTPALSGISLHIMPGEVVALVGENGAGKTTLIKLMARLYDPDQGCVRLDGVDVKEWSLESLHRCIAFLPQGFARYEATAADNIAYGDWQRLLERPEQIQATALSAGVHDLMLTLPRAYDTVLGPMFGEHNLSSGQWQRLAVARTLARDAALLILDEPSAHLDAHAEYEFFCRFRSLAQGRTTLLVSHRFTTLSMADRILVLDGGRLVESGTHEALLTQGGTYAHLYDMHQRQMGCNRHGKERLPYQSSRGCR